MTKKHHSSSVIERVEKMKKYKQAEALYECLSEEQKQRNNSKARKILYVFISIAALFVTVFFIVDVFTGSLTTVSMIIYIPSVILTASSYFLIRNIGRLDQNDE
jgi:hypothetical protein